VSIGVGQQRTRERSRARARKPAAAAPSSVPAAAVGVGADAGTAVGAVPDKQLPAAEAPPAGRQVLVLLPVNGGDTVVLVPQREDGGFSNEDLRKAAVAFSAQSPGKVHALAPRLLDLVYRAVRHFNGGAVHVVSGFRRDRAGSRHTQGRAVDMRIDGVDNKELSAYLRGVGFAGVGFYPASDFVHLDVRDASYYWVDDSAPGAPTRLRQVHEEQARKADAEARARGEKPDVFVPNNRREDAAAAKVYAERRAQQRREARAQRGATRSPSDAQ
jgi:uncharacterized protein YcbK (DUF882 family)